MNNPRMDNPRLPRKHQTRKARLQRQGRSCLVDVVVILFAFCAVVAFAALAFQVIVVP